LIASKIYIKMEGQGGEPRKEESKDYYAGYYWGNDPYDSSEISGRKSDEELKHSIRENIGKNNKINSDSIEISVNNATAILNGSVKTYEERRLAGQSTNDLQVSEPETAGPSKVS
jgi:osmotically-inducible protein OsmY